MWECHLSVVIPIDTLPKSEMERQVCEDKNCKIWRSAEHDVLWDLPSIWHEVTLDEGYIYKGLGDACEDIP